MVTGRGDIVRGGGRVVKNVAGFDLTRLAIGSWGTLGVLTEATVRLRALPRSQATLAIGLSSAAQQIDSVRARLRELPFVPLAATLVDRNACRSLGIAGAEAVVLVRLGGNDDAVRAEREQIRALGEAQDLDGAVWDRLQLLEPATAVTFRLSALPSAIGRTWQAATLIASRWSGAYCHADLGRGVVRVVLPLTSETRDTHLQSLLGVPFGGTRIYERLPAALWSRLTPSAIVGEIERRIKTAFDPHNILNPGIFGELQ
jgi:glycolate oxidase FAD binding subunit